MKITICGSATFAQEMGKTAEELRKKGLEVFTPEPLVTEEWYQENYGREKFLEMKPVWSQKHFKRIENSDAVLIMNHKKKGIEGYFGSHTLMELSVAFYLGKRMFLLNPIQEDHPHYEELIRMNFIILDGDLSKVE
jgi:hypothetical protein